jgi:hypothetical protein
MADTSAVEGERLQTGSGVEGGVLTLPDVVVTSTMVEMNADAVSALCTVLFRHDPIGIADGANNPDEYLPEAAEIWSRMAQVGSVEETAQMVHRVFVRWFNEDIAGGVERYVAIATELRAMQGRFGG